MMRILSLSLFILLAASAARAADLEVGQAAPEFNLSDQNGTVQKLSDYKGKTVVLAFFPKADTAG